MKNLKKVQIICILLFLCITAHSIYAKEVKPENAKKVAINVFANRSGKSKLTIKIAKSIPVYSGNELVFTIFYFSPTGYIIVS